jgi:hypothetical protein
MALVGIGGGGLMVIFILGIFVLYFFMIMFAIFASSMP